ncbi:MAG: hypothetical protein GWN62_37795 [Aliifodinibius sp.]|nr:hypothetical protein [Fodinibius sp.]
MATEILAPLTASWVEAGEGPLLIVLVSGTGFWVYNGPSAPADDDNYMPVNGPVGETSYSYSGTEKTFVKRGEPKSGINTVVSVLEIV